jgi:hypothetical protein
MSNPIAIRDKKKQETGNKKGKKQAMTVNELSGCELSDHGYCQ